MLNGRAIIGGLRHKGSASLLGRHFGDGVAVVEYGNLTAALALLQGSQWKTCLPLTCLRPSIRLSGRHGFLAHRFT